MSTRDAAPGNPHPTRRPDQGSNAPDPENGEPAGHDETHDEHLIAHEALRTADGGLRAMLERHGPIDPYAWVGQPIAATELAGLVLHVVAQQISIPAALTIYGRLTARLGGEVTAAGLGGLSVDDIRAVGISGAKARSLQQLGTDVDVGRLDLDALRTADDPTVVRVLTAQPGIGPWSASMFLLHQLRRPDIFPAGDVGLRIAVGLLDHLDARPTIPAVTQRSQVWAPWRSYAAAHLWLSLRDGYPHESPAETSSGAPRR